MFLSDCVSSVGSEATVGKMLEVNDDFLLLWKFNSGELCDECPLKGL